MITPGVERDEIRHRLFHFYQNRPKDVLANSNGTDVDQDKEEIEQRQKEVGEAEGRNGCRAGSSRRSPDWGQHLNGIDGGVRSKSPAQRPR